MKKPYRSDETITNQYLVNKIFSKYLVSAILILLAATVGTTIDALFVSNLLGDVPLQALNVAMPFFMLASTLPALLGAGGAIMMGILIGHNNTKKANSVFCVTLATGIVIACLLTILCITFFSEIPTLLGASALLQPHVSDYIKGLLFCLIPLFVQQVFLPFASRDSDPTISLIAIITLSATNAIFDYVFVGVFKMGMFGMGLATSIAYVASLLIAFTHLTKKINTLHFRFRELRNISVLITVANYGTPSAIYMLASMVRLWLINALFISLAITGALSAFAVLSSLSAVINGIIMGTGNAIAPLISIFYGEKDNTAIKHTLTLALKRGLVVSLFVSAVLLVFPETIAALFDISEGETLYQTKLAIRFYALSLPLCLVSSVLICAYQSSGQVKFTNILVVLKTLVYTCVFILAFVGIIGANAIWLSYIVTEALAVITILLIYSFREKRLILNFVQCFDFCSVAPDVKIFEASIKNNIEQVDSITHKMVKFTAVNGINEKKAKQIALCVEEMSRNIIEHGFTNEKEHFIDIKLLKSNEKITLRIRDDGIMFNPLKYEQVDDGNLTMGIRLIKEVAKDITYRYCIGLNNLIIEL